MTRLGCSFLLAAMLAAAPAPAAAQSPLATGGGRCTTSPSSPLLHGTVRGVARMPDRTALAILGLGAVASFGAHAVDTDVSGSLRGDRTLHRLVEPGATIGGMPFETGAAAAIMALGHAMGRPCLGSLGSELLQAQFVGAAWTIALKHAMRRSRPDGTGFSFPSGHTTTAFASATVLQRRFGWKAGIPAYAVAGYVGLSRIQMQRHYVSDVAFGAALGIVAGRTVSVGHGRQLRVEPLASDIGTGIGFSLIRKP